MKPFSLKTAKIMSIGFIVFSVIWAGFYAVYTERGATDGKFIMMVFCFDVICIACIYGLRAYTVKRASRTSKK